MIENMFSGSDVSEFRIWMGWADRYVILTHMGPDGDAVGSSLAFCRYLQSKGKQAVVLVPDSAPDFLKWMPGADQMKVYVALEFVNNSGKDFWGMNNLIKNGATFYVTAELDPNKGRDATDLSEGITWPDPDKFKMPPYYTQAEADATPGVNAGDTKKIRRVFMQDYVTEANFVITKKTLQNALVAVPDLRSAQISLGLSVDLVWRQGLVFNDVHVGQNQ